MRLARHAKRGVFGKYLCSTIALVSPTVAKDSSSGQVAISESTKACLPEQHEIDFPVPKGVLGLALGQREAMRTRPFIGRSRDRPERRRRRRLYLALGGQRRHEP